MSKKNRRNKSHEGNQPEEEHGADVNVGEVDAGEVHSGESIELSSGDTVTINEVQDPVEDGGAPTTVADADTPADEEVPADYQEDLADESEGHTLYEDQLARDEQERDELVYNTVEPIDDDGPSIEQIDAFEATMSEIEEVERSPEETIAALRAELESLQRQGEGRRVKSGSKPRPNAIYTLINKPPQWSSTPQLAQIEQILFNNRIGQDGSFVGQLTEPQVFELLEDGKSRGALRTNQPAVRVFQYYRNRMLKENTLRWE